MNMTGEEARAAYAVQARAEAKRLHAFGRKLGRSVAAYQFHARADNLETAATVLDGSSGLDLEHHAAHATKLVERGGVAP